MDLETASAPGVELLGDLRVATRAQHDRIERLLALDAPMPLARYAAILRGFHSFLAPWETQLRHALPERLHTWLDARRRLGFAADDLAYLGAALPPPAPLPAGVAGPGLAAAFGSLYVIEGSALGGQVITRWLRRDLGLGPGRGASYFHGHGDHTGAMWREFRQRAAAEVGVEPAARREACDAAQRTFQTLARIFEPLNA